MICSVVWRGVEWCGVVWSGEDRCLIAAQPQGSKRIMPFPRRLGHPIGGIFTALVFPYEQHKPHCASATEHPCRCRLPPPKHLRLRLNAASA
eukprot:354768-Chlamydomonas_euryale.AAC.2